MVQLNDKTFDHFIESGFSLVLFGANYCSLCKRAEMKLLEFEQKYNIKAGKVDLNRSLGLVNRYRFKHIPVLVLYKDGTEQVRVVGDSFRRIIKFLKGGQNEEDQIYKGLS